jgi:CRISPR-associated protein Csb2
MPWEKKGPADRTMVFDTFVAVGRREPLFVHWPDAILSPEDSSALVRLAANLTTFGRAEGWVHAETLETPAMRWNCVPSAAAGMNQQLVAVFCPDPETAFGDEHYPPPPDPKKLTKGLKPNEYLFDCPRWHLCLDTEIIHAERWPQVPGARWVSYTRPVDAFTAKAAPTPHQSGSRNHPTVARFLLDGPVLPLVTDTVRVAEAFRAAAMGRFAGWCRRQPPAEVEPFRRMNQQDRYSSPVLSGKDASGHFLPGHDHAHYLPLAEGDDRRRLTHLTVYAGQGFGRGETAALNGVRQLQVGDLQLRAQLVGLGQPSDFRAELLGGSSGEAREWVSVTPYIGPAHIGRCGRMRYLRRSLRREAQRWLTRRQLAVEVKVETLPDTGPLWAGRPRAFEFHRSRARPGEDGYRRPFGTFRLTFSAPIAGPLCLGYACHYGLGLFLPVRAAGGSER